MKSSDDFEESEYDIQYETEVEYIVDYFEALDAIDTIEDGVVASDGEKVFTKIRDAANVALVVSKMGNKAFAAINHTADGLTKIGISFERVLDFFSGTSSKSSVVMTYPVTKDEMGGNYLHIDILDEDVQFYCPLLDVGSVSDIPDMDMISCSTRLDIPGKELKKTIKHCKKVETDKNKEVVFRTDDDKLIISSEDPTEGSVDKKFHAAGPSSEANLGQKETSVSLEYLKDIKDVIGSADEVTIHIDQEYPVRIDVPIGGGSGAKIIYVIAPRIESDS